MLHEEYEEAKTWRYDELAAHQRDWWDKASEDVKHQMLVYNDVPFEDWVLSQTKEGDVIEINDYKKTFSVVGNYLPITAACTPLAG